MAAFQKIGQLMSIRDYWASNISLFLLYYIYLRLNSTVVRENSLFQKFCKGKITELEIK
jgi:hypothetical protein